MFTGFDMSTKLKLLGVDVASFGDAFGAHAGRPRRQPLRHRHRRLQEAGAVSADSKHLLGGMLVGDASRLRRAAADRPEPDRAAARARDADPAGRRGRRQARGRRRRRPARRGADLLVQQRQQGRDLQRHPRAEAGRRRRGQDLHQGRHRLRLVRAAGHRAAQGRAEARRRRRLEPPLRALPAQPPGAVPPGPLAQASRRSTRADRATARAAAARSASPRWRRSWRRPGTTHPDGAEARGRCRTPTTASWPTSSATARTRSCRASPAGEITPDQLIALGQDRQDVRPLHQDHRRPAHRPVRRARRAAARRSGASWSPPASSRATPTARRCAP